MSLWNEQLNGYYHRGQRLLQLWERHPILKPLYTDFESQYNPDPVIQWMTDHWEVPIIAVTLYIILVTFGPSAMDKFNVPKLNLRYPVAVWNTLLSVFSFIGMMRTVPHLISDITTYDYMTTVCAHPHGNWGGGATGVWVQLFILSKLPELIDTLWLVLRRREIIFLHWYHHVTVLLYCWHAYTNEAGAGLYFVAMNYSVHAIMYGYYCLQTLQMIPKGFPSWIITLAQIAQMFVGTGVCISCWYYMLAGVKCNNTFGNLVAGGLMYGSYLYLFIAFAVKRFILKPKKPAQKTEKVE